MKALITVEVPDEFIAGRVAELNGEIDAGEWGADAQRDTPESFLLGRLGAVCEDELPIALWGWPATFTVEAA